MSIEVNNESGVVVDESELVALSRFIFERLYIHPQAELSILLVDVDALTAAQRAGDVLGANAILMDAYNTDVRPLLAEIRGTAGLDPDPMAAYARSCYPERIVAERVGGEQAGWGA